VSDRPLSHRALQRFSAASQKAPIIEVIPHKLHCVLETDGVHLTIELFHRPDCPTALFSRIVSLKMEDAAFSSGD
jgi:hypothetical protein